MTIMMIVPFISAIAVLYGRFVRNLTKQTTDASAELTKFAEERMNGIRTVRAFSQEPAEVVRYTEKADQVYNLGMKEGYASALFFSSVNLNLSWSNW